MPDWTSPDWKTIVRQRLAPLRLNAAAEADLNEELAQHLEDRFRELRSGGATDEEAYRTAMVELEDMRPMRAGLHSHEQMPKIDVVPIGDARSGNLVSDFWRDLRYALRTMRKSPVFVMFVVGTLALGIGANTTVFTIINTLLLNPIPVQDPGGLAAVAAVETNRTSKSSANFPLSYADVRDYQERNRVFSSLAGYTTSRVVTLQDNGVSERMFAEMATHNYFSTLGLTPARGRFFLPEEEDNPGTHPVAVLNYGTWKARFGARGDIVGKTVKLNNIAFTVIGIAPPGFIGVNAIFGPDCWLPASMAEALFPNELHNALTDRAKTVFTALGRYKPGVTQPQASADLTTIASALASEYPADEGRGIAVLPVRDVLFGSASTGASSVVFASLLLLVVVGIVLLIACSNVANLLLARSASRRHEMAVRLALGANRRRLIRQLLTESVLLGLCSGALGLFFSYAGLKFLFGRLPAAANFITPKLDINVFAFALAISLITAFLFGMLPAFRASRANVADTLKEEARTLGRGGRKVTVANALVVGQVAFSFLLLVTAALFLRSIGNAYKMDPGFQTSHLATFMISPGQDGYSKPQTKEFYRAARDRIAAMPGIASASWASNLPLWARSQSGLEVEGRQQRSRSDNLRAIVTTVDSSYFETTGIRIDSGRAFTLLDQENSMPVAIVNEKMAHDYWPAGALGKRIQAPGEKQMRQIVGVARNANYTNWGEAPQLCVYVPLEQNYSDAMVLFVRTQGDPHDMLRPVEKEVRAVAPQITASFSRTGPELVEGGLFQARMGVGLLTVFGLLALGLASIGLYGILAYSVNQRKREIGLRMALGATPSSVLRLVLREGMSLVAVGVVIGFLGALGVGKVLSGILFGVSASDPLSVGAAVLTLSTIALVACYFPAYLATRVDPVTALHEA